MNARALAWLAVVGCAGGLPFEAPDAAPVHDDIQSPPAPRAPAPDAGPAVALAPGCAPPMTLANPTKSTSFHAGYVEYAAGAMAVTATLPSRLAGMVYYPAGADGRGAPPAAGRFPVVVVLHGHHQVLRVSGQAIECDKMEPRPIEDLLRANPAAREIPNHLGYAYLAAHLAAAGHVVVALNANDLHCKTAGSPGLITERVVLLRETLRLVQRMGAGDPALGTAAALLKDHLDLDALVLLGHSRGGEAVVEAARDLAMPGLRLRGVVSFAPSGYLVPALKNVPLLVIFGSADGDVTYAAGALIYDGASGGPGWFKAQQFVLGGNHNFFNTEWTDPLPQDPAGDDGAGNGDGRLTAEDQRAYAKVVTRVFLDAVLRDRGDLRGVLAGATPLDGLPAGRVWPSFAEAAPPLVAAPSALGFRLLDRYEFTLRAGAHKYNQTFFHATEGLVAVWESGRPELSLALAPERPPAYVSLRVAQVVDPHNRPDRTLGLELELEDAAGRRASASAAWTRPIVAYYPRPPEKDALGKPAQPLAKTMLGTLRVPASCFAGVALGELRVLRLKMRDDSGALALTDFQLVP